MNEITKMENRILEVAKNKLKVYEALIEALIYDSAQTFWNIALNYKLCTKEEYNDAQKHYGELWNYVGD